MTEELARANHPGFPTQFADRLPPMVAVDERAAWRFVDFFAVTIRNPNTREAYYRAVCRFMDWCETRCLVRLDAVMPIHVPPTSSISRSRGPRSGSTCPPSAGASTGWCREEYCRPTLRLRSRDPGTSSAWARLRCSATRRQGRCSSLSPLIRSAVSGTGLSSARCFTPSDGSGRSSPWTSRTTGSPITSACSCCTRREARSTRCRRTTGWLSTLESTWTPLGLWQTPKAPLFQALDITRSRLKGTRMNRQIVFQMVRRRARAAGLPPAVNCHSFRATGITNYLSNGGSLEDARAIAAHESSQTTRLYDRTGDRITLDEIERIRF